MNAEKDARDAVIKAITALEGVAAVNLLEPSQGDLERVTKAYNETLKELASAKAEVEYLSRQLSDKVSGCCDCPMFKSLSKNSVPLSKVKGLVSILEEIAKNEWDFGNGIKVTGSEHTLMQKARLALADWKGE